MARNNASRLGLGENKIQDSSPPPAATGDSGFQFVTPTEFVELPTQGKYYPEGHPLHGQKTVEIRFMTAKEEDILTSPALIKNNMVIDRLLQSVIVDKTIDPNYLFIGDKNALIIATRVTGYGPEYATQVMCPSCYSPSEEAFNLEDTNLYKGGEYEDYDIEESDEGTFFVNLPMSKVRVEVRLLLGKDEKYLAELSANKQKGGLTASPLTDQFKRVIIGVNGHRDRGSVDKFVENMPARDYRYLRSAYGKIVPNVDMKFGFDCPKCNHQSRVEVPLGPGFLWPST